jgi:hypothetical protein
MSVQAAYDPLVNQSIQTIANHGQLEGFAKKNNLLSHTISTPAYEKIDPWRSLSMISLMQKGINNVEWHSQQPYLFARTSE